MKVRDRIDTQRFERNCPFSQATYQRRFDCQNDDRYDCNSAAGSSSQLNALASVNLKLNCLTDVRDRYSSHNCPSIRSEVPDACRVKCVRFNNGWRHCLINSNDMGISRTEDKQQNVSKCLSFVLPCESVKISCLNDLERCPNWMVEKIIVFVEKEFQIDDRWWQIRDETVEMT